MAARIARDCELSSWDSISQFSFEGAVQHGWEQGVEFGGGLGLQPLLCVELYCDPASFNAQGFSALERS
jgi:hypothetical protein